MDDQEETLLTSASGFANNSLRGGNLVTDEDLQPASTGRKGRSTLAKGTRSLDKKPWDDNQYEFLVALRACKKSFQIIHDDHFQDWSKSVLKRKGLDLGDQPRWQAKAKELLSMGPEERLAAIGRAATAAGRPYSQQSQEREEDGDIAGSGDPLECVDQYYGEDSFDEDYAEEGVDLDGEDCLDDRQGKFNQRFWSRRKAWDDTESELLFAARACKLSFSIIRDRHFRHWTSNGIIGKFHQLKLKPHWTARYEEVLNMEEPERLAVVENAESAVYLCRGQRAQEGQAEALEDGDLIMDDSAHEDFGHNNADGASEDGDDVDEGPVHEDRPSGLKPWSKAWSDSESELLVALRACGVAWKVIRRHHFPEWKSESGLSSKLSILKEQPHWQTRFSQLQGLSEIEQRAVIDSKLVAVDHIRHQRLQQQGQDLQQGQDQEQDDEGIVEGHVGTTGEEYGNIAEDGDHVDDTVDEFVNRGSTQDNAYQTLEPAATQKRKRGGQKGVRAQHDWDDFESELLVALRARGLSFPKIAERDFPSWSGVGLGLKLKLDRLRKIERWEARFLTIHSMDESEQLATIALAQEAVARARGQRARAQVVSQDDDEASAVADGVVVDKLAKNGSTGIRNSTAASNEFSVNETSNSHSVGKDIYEISDTPDPEMARTASAQLEVSMDLDEDESSGAHVKYIDTTREDEDNSNEDTEPMRPIRNIHLPARYRDGEQ